MTKEQIIEAVKALKIRLEWHSFRAVPSDHCFATYNIPSKTFDGADEMAFYRHFPFEVTFFYRENKTAADDARELQFETAVRPCGAFSCVMGYDDSNGLFYTQYNFNLTELMED